MIHPKRSDELPRFVGPLFPGRSIHWQRRYTYMLVLFLLICWLWYPLGRTSPANGRKDDINWSSFAYSLWAIDTTTLCHAVLHLDALARLESKADRVLFHPHDWDTRVDSSSDRESQLLVIARDTYGAKLHPIQPLTVEGRTKGTDGTSPLHGLALPSKARHLTNDR